MAEGLFVKLPSDECDWPLLMISQHCFGLQLGAIRQQAITWAKVDPDLCCHMASLGYNDLRKKDPILLYSLYHYCWWPGDARNQWHNNRNYTDWVIPEYSGPQFNIKMTSCHYRRSHCGDKTILRPSYLHNGISYIGKMSSLYWIGALASVSGAFTLNIFFISFLCSSLHQHCLQHCIHD